VRDGRELGFKPRSYATELLRSYRFYFKSFSHDTAPAQAAGATGAFSVLSQASGSFGSTFRFPVPMRTTPNVTTYNPVNANANWYDANNGADRTASTARQNDKQVAIFGASGVAGGENLIHITADAEL